MAWSPLGERSCWPTAFLRELLPAQENYDTHSHRDTDGFDQMADLRGVSRASLALAWLLRHPARALCRLSAAPIPRASARARAAVETTVISTRRVSTRFVRKPALEPASVRIAMRRWGDQLARRVGAEPFQLPARPTQASIAGWRFVQRRAFDFDRRPIEQALAVLSVARAPSRPRTHRSSPASPSTCGPFV